MTVFEVVKSIEKDLVAAANVLKEKHGPLAQVKLNTLSAKLKAASSAFHIFLEDVYGYEIGNDSYGDACPDAFDKMSASLTAFAHILKTVDAPYRQAK